MTPPGAWMTPEAVRLARELWDAGEITRVIAERVGCSKNALLGFAHRQGWPPRPNPAGNRHNTVVVPRVTVKRHRKAATLPPLEATQDAPEVVPVPEVVVLPPQGPLAPVARPVAVQRGCQWIEHGCRPWTMCDDPTVAGSAYCASHRARCYYRSARQEAA